MPLKTLIGFIRRHRKTLLLSITVSSATLLVSTIVSIWLNNFHNVRLPTLGTIRAIGVEVYGGNLTNGAQLDWGTIYPGTLTNRSFYVQSESNTPVTLSLKQLNFTLLNSKGENVTDYLPLPPTEALNITWNCGGVVLNPRQETFATLTLNVTRDFGFVQFLINYNVVEFNFDIRIEAKPIE